MPPHRHTALDSDDTDDEQHSVQTTAPSSTRRTASSKTETSTGSDKENRARRGHEEDDEGDGGDEDDDGEEEEEEVVVKKDKGKGKATQALHEKVIAEEGDKQFYDPDQKPEERRFVRKGLRELGRSLNGKYTYPPTRAYIWIYPPLLIPL